MTADQSHAEHFELVLRTFRERCRHAGEALPLAALLEMFHGDSAAWDLEAAINFGTTAGLIERVPGKGYLLRLSKAGAVRAGLSSGKGPGAPA
jgi:hypothetical protein